MEGTENAVKEPSEELVDGRGRIYEIMERWLNTSAPGVELERQWFVDDAIWKEPSSFEADLEMQRFVNDTVWKSRASTKSRMLRILIRDYHEDGEPCLPPHPALSPGKKG